MNQIAPVLMLTLTPLLPAVPQDATAAETPTETTVHWPSFRGPQARGIAEGCKTATKWDVARGKNIAWKTKIPGLTHSSPVIWGNRIYLTAAVRDGEAELKVGLYGSIAPVQNEGEYEFRVLSLDKSSGEILWSKTAWKGEPAIKRHPKGSHAASTPATDGKHVVAFFGSEGLYCYDDKGKQLWKRDFGVLDAGYFQLKRAQWGFASSPVIHGDKVLVQCDVQDDSFIAALELKTGKTIWKTPRKEVPTWSTPTVHTANGRSQVIANGWKHIGGYDLATGKELWWLAGGGDIPVPTPIIAHDLIFITNAHGRYQPILAIATKAKGELSMDADEHEDVVWAKTRRLGNYMQTPLVVGDELYLCNDMGILKCLDARTGKQHYKERLGDGRMGFTASGVAADGKLYFSSEAGEVLVIKAGPTFEKLANNELGETFMSTPAISEGTIFFRAREHLIAVAPK